MIFYIAELCTFILPQTVDAFLNAFAVQRSVRNMGTLYDNTIAEALFKDFKTEFVRN